MNLETKNELEINDITRDIKNESKTIKCEDIGEKWIKNCPKCGKIQNYSDKYKLKRSIDNNSKCGSCRQLLCDKSDFYFRKCPECNNSIEYKSRVSFLQANKKHRKCIKCIGKLNTSSTKLFIQKSKTFHKKKFDYSKSIYKNSSTKVIVECPKHGEFLITPNNHLRGRGCLKCWIEKKPSNKTEFIQKSTKLFKCFYDYSKVKYINCRTKISIICPKHGEFFQIPESHLKGHGCSKCHFEKLSNITISKRQTEFLDYLKIDTRNISIDEFIVDGLKDKTIYEFLGDYWHGNPEKFDGSKFNTLANKTFKELYDYTFWRFNKLKNVGFDIKYIWENDWINYKKGKDSELRIKTM